MNTKTWLAVELAALLWVFSASAAELSASRPSFDAVVKIAAITSRDSGGHAQRFKDASDREFAVKYDAQQRVQAVEATRGPHISDIISVGYAPDGTLIGAKFRSGYTLFFDYRPDGTQVIRDSQGAVLRRETGMKPLQSLDGVVRSDRLISTVTEFESLMKSLAQARR